MIQAKKSLGQNFLRSEKALNQIVEAGDIQPSDTVLEIGPGEGALTEKILEKFKTDKKGCLIAIEKDDRLIPILEEKFKKEIGDGIFHLVHGDIVEIMEEPLSSYLEKFTKNKSKNEGDVGFKVIANIPYYITGLIIRKLFEQNELPEKVVLLVQKEVADRIVAGGDNGKTGLGSGGKESLLSISVKLYGEPKRIAVVPKGAFVPAPSVDSAIILIDKIERKIQKEKEEDFFRLIKAGFSHKRKRFIKNVSEQYKKENGPTINIESAVEKEGLDINVRAEDISLEQYINIFKNI